MKGLNRAGFWAQHPQWTGWTVSLCVHGLCIGGLLVAGLWYLGASNALRRPIPARAYGEKLEERVGSVRSEPHWSVSTFQPNDEAVVVLVPDEFPCFHQRMSRQPNQPQGAEYASEAISDVPLGGWATNPALGPGGGGAGNYASNIKDDYITNIRSRAHGLGGPIEEFTGGPAINSAKERALAWLLTRQKADGSWGARIEGASEDADAIATASVVIALNHAQMPSLEAAADIDISIQRAAAWLIKNQNPDGSLYGPRDSDAPWGEGGAHAIVMWSLAESLDAKQCFEQGEQAIAKAFEFSSKKLAPSWPDRLCGWVRNSSDSLPHPQTTVLMSTMLDNRGWTRFPALPDCWDRRLCYFSYKLDRVVFQSQSSSSASVFVDLSHCQGFIVSSPFSDYIQDKAVWDLLKNEVVDVPEDSMNTLLALSVLKLAVKVNHIRVQGARKRCNALARMIVDRQDEDGGWSGGGEWDQGWGRVGRTALFLRCLNEVSPAER